MLFSRICALTGQTVRMLSAVKMPIPLFSEDSTASGLLLCLVQRLYRLPQPGPSWRKPPAAGDIAPLYGQKSGFPDSYRRKLPLSTVRNPVFQIRTVGYCLSLRVKMTEFYFLPYKTTKIYGKGTEIRCFGRSERPISTGQNAILLISSVEACRRSDSGSLAGRRTGIRPVIPDRLRR